MARNGKCTPIGAWNLLKDGEWHALSEIKEKLGSDGTKRTRELRTREYGEWDVETGYPSDVAELIESGKLPKDKSYRRIKPEQLADPAQEHDWGREQPLWLHRVNIAHRKESNR